MCGSNPFSATSLFPQYALDNIWYVGGKFAPIYHARKLNASGYFSPPLPSLGRQDIVFVPQPWEYFRMDWMQQFLRLSTGGAPRVEYGE